MVRDVFRLPKGKTRRMRLPKTPRWLLESLLAVSALGDPARALARCESRDPRKSMRYRIIDTKSAGPNRRIVKQVLRRGVIGYSSRDAYYPLVENRVLHICESDTARKANARTWLRRCALADIFCRATGSTLDIAQVAAETTTRDIFLAAMSHELRTPLSVIVGNVSLMRRDTTNYATLTLEQQQRLDTIGRCTEQLAELISDVLDFVRLRSGQLRMQAEPTRITDCINDAILVVRDRAAEAGVTIETYIADDVPKEIHVDPRRLRQVFINLLSNSLKFTRDGHIYVRINAQPLTHREPDEPVDVLEAARWRIDVDIEDEGEGILPEDAERIFEMFYQGSRRRLLDTAKGTGLGLSICRVIVEMMGGHIWANTNVPNGALLQFHVIVEEPICIEDLFKSCRDMMANSRVMVIDDNTDNRVLMLDRLVGWGMLPTVCGSGLEAMRIIEYGNDTFDVAVVDVNMPTMNGIELAHQLIRLQPSIVLVGLSSVGRDVADREIFDYFAVRPVDEATLMRMVCQALKKHRDLVPDIPDHKTSMVKRLKWSTEHNHGSPLMGETVKYRLIPGNHARVKILVVEDDADNANVLVEMLHALGYMAVDHAHDGLDALNRLSEDLYDVVLMDLRMPRMDGLQCARTIRARVQRLKRPVIVALSASALPSDRDECRKVGMDGHIAKPVSLEQLGATMKRIHAHVDLWAD